MSDGSDGAGGVGGNGGSNGAGNDASAADSIGNAAESLGQQAVDSLSAAVSEALGSMASALGIDNALGQIADALGLNTQDLQGLIGAAIMGAVTGGLPGAVMGVANALAGGSLADAARSAVADNMPASMQAAANLAIDAFASNIPGANVSVQNALGTFASGALTNGQVPGISDIGALARSVSGLESVAQGLMSATTRGDFSSMSDAVTSLESNLQSSFSQAREVTSAVAAAMERGQDVYASGNYGAFGNAVEQVAVETARLLGNR